MKIWKDIFNYEGSYQVSELGEIRSLDRKIVYSNGRVYFQKGIDMKIFEDKDGYNYVALSKNKKKKKFKVHRLVAQAFIPNPTSKPQVNHIDGNKKNNKVENLEWVTNQENMTHAVNTGLRVNSHKNRKKPVVATEISTNKKYVFNSIIEASNNLETGKTSISNCLKGKKKSFNGYTFKYL